MYNAAFFDIDGTLQSFNTKTIPASAVEALHILRAKGLKVVIATGRHKSELSKIREVFEFDAYITLNGQYCFDNSGVYYKVPLDRADVALAVEQCDAGLYSCFFVEEDAKYVNRLSDDVREVYGLVGTLAPVVANPAKALGAEVLQLCVYLPVGGEGVFLDRAVNVEITRWHPNFFDVAPRGGSKQSGIDATLRHFGLTGDGVIAFGDGENDAVMIANARTGVAMGNAGLEAKAVADYITDDVDNDGVLKAVKKFIV